MDDKDSGKHNKSASNSSFDALNKAKEQVNSRIKELNSTCITSLALENFYHQTIRTVLKLNKSSNVDAWIAFQEAADSLAKLHRMVHRKVESLHSLGFQEGYHTMNREFLNHVGSSTICKESIQENQIILMDHVQSFFPGSSSINPASFPHVRRRSSKASEHKRPHESSSSDDDTYSDLFYAKRPCLQIESSDDEDYFEDYECQSSDESSSESYNQPLFEAKDNKSTKSG